MKKILFSLLAIATLAACSKSDDDNNNNGGGNNGNGGTTSTTVTSTTQTPTVKAERMISFERDGKHTYESVAYYENGKITSFSDRKLINGVQTGTTQISTIKYDAQGRIQERKEAREDGSFDEEDDTETFFYDASGNLERKEITYPMKSNGNGTIEYKYENGKLKQFTYKGSLNNGKKHYKIQVFNYTNNSITVNIKEYNTNAQEVIEDSSVSTSTTIYTLSNGNVVKKEETREYGKTVTTFKHDNAKTLFSLRPFFAYPEYFDETDVNKNNITSKEVINTYSHNGQTDTYKSTYRYEYEYTPEGYPKTIKEFRNDTLEGIKEYEY
ncbi:membrane lipoprotein lipid attachment site-containing protein [Capnocytophaga sputigena]